MLQINYSNIAAFQVWSNLYFYFTFPSSLHVFLEQKNQQKNIYKSVAQVPALASGSQLQQSGSQLQQSSSQLQQSGSQLQQSGSQLQHGTDQQSFIQVYYHQNWLRQQLPRQSTLCRKLQRSPNLHLVALEA